ncbi:MAG: hypothetical protein EBR82_74895 [Caulobacteraceae bacterium]|nr:hypothetical protein [Caulobacteraceae bacterium]
MKTEIVTIKPADAERLLREHNDQNPRNINQRVVRQYAEDMRSGLWQTTHQGIGVSGDSLGSPGVLIDGQHRLSAIVQANIPMRMVVTFGAPAAQKIDFGTKRQLSVVTGIPRSDLACAGVIISSITGQTPMPAQRQLLCEQFPCLGDMDQTQHVSFITRAPIHAAFKVAELNGIRESRTWYVQLVENDVNMPPAIRTLRCKLEKDFKSLFGNFEKRSPAYAVALRLIRCASEGTTLAKIYPDAVLDSLHEYDGRVGNFVRENLV